MSSLLSPPRLTIPPDQMVAPVVRTSTPYAKEDGIFEYPFPATPLPGQPSSPTQSHISPAHNVAGTHRSHYTLPINAMTSKMVTEGPVPPSLATNPAALAFRRATRSGPSYS